MVVCVIFLLFVTTLLKVFTDFWLGQWINDGNGNEVPYNFVKVLI